MVIGVLGTSIHGLTGQSAVLDTLMRIVADYMVYGIVAVLALPWLHRDGLRAGLGFGLGAAAALGIGAVLGAVLVEQRPFVTGHFVPLIAHAADSSFPSDHLLVLGALTGACWMAARRLALVALGLSILVAVARVFVGVHYPIDVSAGFAIGAGCGVTVWFAAGAAGPILDRVDHELRRWNLRRVLFGRPTQPRVDADPTGSSGAVAMSLAPRHRHTSGIPLDARWWSASSIALACLPLVAVSAYHHLVLVLIACAILPLLFARQRQRVVVGRLCWGVAVLMTISGLLLEPARQSRPNFWLTLTVAALVAAALAAFLEHARPASD